MEQRRESNPWLPLLLVFYLLLSVAFSGANAVHGGPNETTQSSDGSNGKGAKETTHGGSGDGDCHGHSHGHDGGGDCHGHSHGHHGGGDCHGKRAQGTPATSNPWVVTAGPRGAAPRPEASGFTAAAGVVLVAAAAGWLVRA